jgi:4-hydroxy-tetrahydrodipicolinate reductase
MKIALIGYGKMGQTIEKIAVERGHEIVARINSSTPLADSDLSIADIAIEFTRPELAPFHIRHCADIKLPVVVGTTAWLEELDELSDYMQENNGSMLHASNFSIGVNIFFEINKRLAQLMTGRTDYKACIEEIHHLQKLDAPSGTAITLANGILENNGDYLSWVLGEGTSPHTNEQQLGVTSIRLPDVPGTHIISYTSEIDTLKISHEAHSRKGFALGAVVAAEWLLGKKGIYTMNDVLNLNN